MPSFWPENCVSAASKITEIKLVGCRGARTRSTSSRFPTVRVARAKVVAGPGAAMS
jgi:hypothetical protein